MADRLSHQKKPLGLTSEIYSRAIVDSLKETQPAEHGRNPVMFVVEVGASSRPGFGCRPLGEWRGARMVYRPRDRSLALVYVLFANFSEALAEGEETQAEGLRKARKQTMRRASRMGRATECRLRW